MNALKYTFLIASIICQITGFVFLFIDVQKGVLLFLTSIVFFLLIIALFIYERQKEKEEEDRNDYRDY
ncbi:MAG: hypothetical protein H0Z32_10525 [Bacillaceae bacterium]|nr:hypothetical protein [Bacillaceae bacterium]